MLEALQRLAAEWPERYVPERADVAFDARSLRDWVAHLPMANTAATSRQLFDALASMNRLLLDPHVRLDALEMLRPLVAQVVATLERQLAVETLPLPHAKLQIARQAQDFEAALLLGYTQSLRDFVGAQGKVPFLKGKAVTLAAVRGLQHANAVLCKSYLAYQAPPPGVWLRLHDIHTIAVGVGVDDKNVGDPLLGGAELSPRSAYAHALLLALSNPYRFNQRELADLAALTLAWAPLCSVRAGMVDKGAFAVNTHCDRGVGYLPEEREEAEADRLGFDPTPALRSVEGSLEMLPPGVDVAQFRLRGGAPVKASGMFIARVMKSWRGNADRGYARLAAGHYLDVVIGLHALHFALAGGEDFDSFLRRVRGQAISLSERGTAAGWAGMYGDQNRPLPQRAKVLDQSLGGYRLMWENGEHLRAKVGELVGLAPPAPEDEQQDWMVGVVRWIRSEADGSVGAGVELLARRAQPVGLASLDDGTAQRPAVRAVMLCDEDTTVGITLLAPNVFDRFSREVELTRPADPFDWDGHASVQRMDMLDTGDTSGAFQRVIIGEALPMSGMMEDAVAMPLAPTGT
jgi:hypothetical protein